MVYISLFGFSHFLPPLQPSFLGLCLYGATFGPLQRPQKWNAQVPIL